MGKHRDIFTPGNETVRYTTSIAEQEEDLEKGEFGLGVSKATFNDDFKEEQKTEEAKAMLENNSSKDNKEQITESSNEKENHIEIESAEIEAQKEKIGIIDAEIYEIGIRIEDLTKASKKQPENRIIKDLIKSNIEERGKMIEQRNIKLAELEKLRKAEELKKNQ